MTVEAQDVADARTDPDQQAAADPTEHPVRVVPDTLFDDPAAEARWRERFSAVRISLPDPGRDVPDHTVYVSNESGRYELYTWDVAQRRQGQGDRPARRHDVRRPVGRRGGPVVVRRPRRRRVRVAAGAAVRHRTRVGGRGTARESRRLPGRAGGRHRGGAGRVLRRRRHPHPPASGDDTADGLPARRGRRRRCAVHRRGVWVLSHSEHGDSRYPALRALSVADGSVLAELSDAPGKGLHPMAFSPVPGTSGCWSGTSAAAATSC